MGLFHRNTNELNFAGGSKNIQESLGGGFTNRQVLVHLDPREDFNTGSTVTVQPGEEAVFIKNGEIIGVLSNGRHQLSTENYPFLSRLRNMITGGVSSFNCRIFYVRTAHSIIPWGTPNGIQYQDYWFRCPTIARGHGEYWISFKNIPKFIENLMGNQPEYTVEQMMDDFNGKISSHITRVVAKKLGDLTKEREVLEFSTMMDELEKLLEPNIQDLLDDYGLELVRYYIEHLEIDEDERRAAAISAVSTARSEAMAKVESAQGDVAAFQTYGSTYQTIKGMELLKDIANNPGAGGVASVGAGLGMGMAAGNVFGSVAQSVFTGTIPQANSQPAQQQNEQENRFGNAAPQTPQSNPMEELTKFKQMLDMGLITPEQFELQRMLVLGMITQAQYDAKIQEIMDRM